MLTTENIGDITTTPDYWDCICFDQYMHNKHEVQVCPRCGAKAEDMPDSRVNEITGSGVHNKPMDNTSLPEWIDKWTNQDFLYR